MGWCSGTEIFDKIVGPIVESDLDNETKTLFVFQIVDALEDKDWDCQSDSNYYDNPIVKSVFKELHPDWFEEEMDELQNERNHLAKLLYQVLTEGEIISEDDQAKFLERYESEYYK